MSALFNYEICQHLGSRGSRCRLSFGSHVQDHEPLGARAGYDCVFVRSSFPPDVRGYRGECLVCEELFWVTRQAFKKMQYSSTLERERVFLPLSSLDLYTFSLLILDASGCYTLDSSPS